MNDIEVKPTNAETAISTLRGRGYDDAAILRFAKAARSWTTKDGVEWKVWKEVESQMSGVT